MGDRAAAQDIMELIEGIPPGLRPPSLGALVHRARARLADSAERATAELAAAEATFRDLGLPFWLAVTRLEHAEVLAAEGRGEDAERMAAEAHATFAELRAQPWVERAAALAGSAATEPIGGPVAIYTGENVGGHPEHGRGAARGSGSGAGGVAAHHPQG
jgi:hypothetical protein